MERPFESGGTKRLLWLVALLAGLALLGGFNAARMRAFLAGLFGLLAAGLGECWAGKNCKRKCGRGEELGDVHRGPDLNQKCGFANGSLIKFSQGLGAAGISRKAAPVDMR